MAKVALIVDDDPVVHHILSAILVREGFEVVITPTAAEALDYIGESVTLSSLPAVTFMDLMLPDSSGIDLIRNIRALTGASKLPIILFSANTREQVQEMPGVELANCFLEKPFTGETVTEALKSLQ